MRSLSYCSALLAALFLLLAATQDDPRRPLADYISPAFTSVSFTPNTTTAEPDDCLLCHDDDEFTMERNGREVSLYIDPERYGRALHSGVDCIECHVGFDPDEEPHLEEITPVDCSACHEEEAHTFQRGGHRSELTCTSCHPTQHAPPRSNEGAGSCGNANCHESEHDLLAISVHGPSCEPGTECVDTEAVTCLDCHSSHGGAAVASDRCITCHDNGSYMVENMPGIDTTAVAVFQGSVHADVIECSDCHVAHDILPIDDPNSAVAHANVAETCAECHDDVAEVYLTSEHGHALAEGFENAPTCTDCHGEHDIRSITDEASHISRATEVDVCLSCHLDVEAVRERMTHSSAFIGSYRESVHGRASEEGNAEAAVCSDCHGAHQDMKASNPASKTYRTNLSETCGACHEEIEAAFTGSIHGAALLDGVSDAPTCTTCHGEHGILEHTLEDSPVATANVSAQVCSPCHNSYKLSEKYDFPSNQVTSFGDSYHGLAGRFGSDEAANCASCHGIHEIYPSTDLRSKVNAANLAQTCGDCHPGANINFAKGSVHIVRSREGEQALWWISTIYLVLIVSLISTMFVHNLLDWFRKLVNQQEARRNPPILMERKTGLYLRMNLSERIQHGALAVSFILLVITGFSLKFPDAWWVRVLTAIGGEAGFNFRSGLHRISAVVMVAAALYHLWYLVFTPRGKQLVKDLWFSRSDFTDMVQTLKYNLGISKEHPRYDRFNYIEKSEYWALVWGTILMTVTGVVLWFENTFMSSYSKLFIDINETIHYWEAWLAFLAIVVWHFYYVIFNPDVYPVNLTWLTGWVTEEEMEKEHPLELERIKQQEAAEAQAPGEEDHMPEDVGES